MIKVEKLRLEGLRQISLFPYEDERGFFEELYRKPFYEEIGIHTTFVQDNHSFSRKNTIRGMHFQQGSTENPQGQDKLLSVLEGEIFDVVVDIRPSSPTFGQWEGIYLQAEKHQQLFIPGGFAHGFCVVSERAHVIYKVSSLYNPVLEKGFLFDDPHIGIAWPVKDPLVSPKDRKNPFFQEIF